ncbi:MAG: divalent-cation tolerance protein CutA [Candidatus Omnitrophica bacterium]|jgi:periplasmic divalent cation tolerance protein|nr:divalent-cation tolerance protein CutA [Candidatus Omnitrophota bacterium]MDD5079880.1 divalent-cation tolerance protein CutA [Candidatus Omnitrophota bacterium]
MRIIVLITAKDKKQARRIADELVRFKLAACVNIVGDVRSIFIWQGKTERQAEVILIVKSTKARFKAIVKMVKSLHSYEVPEVIAVPIIDGSGDYLRWIDESVG